MEHAYLVIVALMMLGGGCLIFILYLTLQHNTMQARSDEFFGYLIAGRLNPADFPKWKTWVNGTNATQPPVKPA